MNILNARRVGYALCMAALLAAGLSTGTRLYYLLFFMLMMMLLLGALSAAWTLWSVRFDLKGVRARVTRGDSLMTVFTVRHTSLLPVSAIRVQLSVPSGYAASQEVNVTAPPFASRTFRQVIPCPHRGVYEAGVTRVSVSDVFGMVTLSRKPNLKLVRMEVKPRVTDIAPMLLKNVDMGPEFRSAASEDNASPSDVRKWQDGDELKKIHWKLSLRKRELMVRTYEESARPDTLVIPDLQQVTQLKDQQLTVEDCVCEASLNAVKAQLEAGYPVRMPLTNARPAELTGQTPVDFPAFVDAMVKVPFDSPYDYERVILLMQARLQRTGGAVLVTARLTTRIADMVLRMQTSGITTRLIWVSDDARDETLTMLERLRMGGVEVEQLDPWTFDRPAQTRSAENDFDDDYD
ncbi:MAG: DUF58 domain-containing protein [Clostridia bacterium]|nr:DUF58 domain-containing protein [Clostridia bacterium]